MMLASMLRSCFVSMMGFKLDGLPEDGDYEVIALGRVGGLSGRASEARCEILLADAGWRNGDPKLPPHTVLVSRGVGQYVLLRPGVTLRDHKPEWPAGEGRRIVVAGQPKSMGRFDRTPWPVCAPRFDRPIHPIVRLQGLRYFKITFDGGREALVPVGEVMRAAFARSSFWMRHMVESHWSLGNDEKRRGFEMPDAVSLPTPRPIVASTAHVTAWRTFDKTDSAAIAAIIGDGRSLESYKSLGSGLRQNRYLEQPC